MTQTVKYGSRSTADHVLAGIDLTAKHILVTGCHLGIGFETASALAANGAHVIAAARTLREAAGACEHIGYRCSPLECDLEDLESVAAAAQAVHRLQRPLDSIVVNAGSGRRGVGQHLSVEHLGHFALLDELADLLRENTGRVVIVTRIAGTCGAVCGIDESTGSHVQSQLAHALLAKELSRRMLARGIAVNSAHPGKVFGTVRGKKSSLAARVGSLAARPFLRTPAQGAATIALLAASPTVAGISGEHWQNCAIARGHVSLDDAATAARWWKISEDLLAQHRAARLRSLARAA